MNKIKVMHVVHSLGNGDGIAQVVFSLITNLSKERFDASVCCLVSGGILAEQMENAGIEVNILNGRSEVSLRAVFSNISAIIKLAYLIRRKKIDILHAHEFFPATLGRVAAIIARVPVIFLTLHNIDYWKKWHHRLVDKILASFTDKIVTNSYAVKNDVCVKSGISEEKFVVVHNGIDLKKFSYTTSGNGLKRELGLKNGEYIIGTVGRWAKQKGYQYLIEASRIARSVRRDIRFVIVGGDAHPSESVKDELFKLNDNLNEGDRVIFTGSRTDIPALISIFDIFVFPSLWEGFGLAFVEAMAMGKPVIASEIGPVSEIVKHHQTGLLVPCGDAKAIANAVIELIENKEMAESMGRSGRKHVESFLSVEGMTKKYDELYQSLYTIKASRKD